MAIFGFIESDDLVQVNDKFRISCVKSYISKGEASITKVEIEPDSGDGFIEVQGNAPISNKNFWLDWQYSSSGSKTISLRITTDGAPVTITKAVECITEASDYLYSSDSDLVSIESDALKYVPDGRNTFKYVHREAQKEILEWLYNHGYFKAGNNRFDKTDLADIEEVKFWSKYIALRLIFEDASNQPGDVLSLKAKQYENQSHKWRDKAILKIDTNGDSILGESEGFNMYSRSLVKE